MNGRVAGEHYEMEYYRFGSGDRTLVIIPGVSMQSVVALGPALESAFAQFASEYTVYLFDRKLDMQEGYSVRDMADDTADAMRRLGVKDAYIYAVSQGAMIAMNIAVYHKELVHMLYISSTQAKPDEKSRAVFEEWIRLCDAGDILALYDKINEKVYSPEYLEHFAAAFEAQKMGGRPEEIPRFRILAAACLGNNIYDKLSEIACPVYVTGSYEDRIVGPEGPASIAEKLDCLLYLYEGYSHAVYDEAPDYFGRMYDVMKNI